MTVDYLQNNCALSYNKSTLYHFEGYRKGMYVELMAMFLIYYAMQIYRAIKLHQQNQNQDKPSQQPQKLALPWHQKQWNKMFPIHFANHAVALSFVLLYDPMPAGLIIAFLHFIFFVLHVVFSILHKQLVADIMLGMMCLCNLFMMIEGLVGIASKSNYQDSKSNECKYTPQ